MTDQDRQAFEALAEDLRCYDCPITETAYRVWLAALAHRDAQLAEVTRQRDELVGAVMNDPSNIIATDHPAYALAARIQSAQPKGEWIDIEPDGSNLPEYVEGAEWCLALTDSKPPEWRRWGDPTRWNYLAGYYDGVTKVVAYYSIPHIYRRPDIPPYEPKEQHDEQ